MGPLMLAVAKQWLSSGCVMKWRAVIEQWGVEGTLCPGNELFIYDLGGEPSEQDDFTLLQVYGGLERILRIVHAK
jgi:hypothetical protein